MDEISSYVNQSYVELYNTRTIHYIISQHSAFYEPKGSLPRLQEPV